MGGKAWTESDDLFLRRHYLEFDDAELAEWLDRSEDGVFHRRRKLGLDRLNWRKWTAGEIAFVRFQFGRREQKTIARLLDRSESSVYQLCAKLGLSRTHQKRGADFDEFLREKHAAGWSDAEIADAWGTHRHAVGDRRRQLGLPVVGQTSEHARDRVRRKTAEQLAREGLPNLAALRVKAFRDRARAAGWPEDLRPRAVQMLNALWDRGPMTRRELADAIGMPWKGSRPSLSSNDPEGSYLAHLAKRGLVIVLPRARRVTGQGRGKTLHVYSLPLTIERGEFNTEDEGDGGERTGETDGGGGGGGQENGTVAPLDADAA